MRRVEISFNLFFTLMCIIQSFVQAKYTLFRILFQFYYGKRYHGFGNSLINSHDLTVLRIFSLFQLLKKLQGQSIPLFPSIIYPLHFTVYCLLRSTDVLL